MSKRKHEKRCHHRRLWREEKKKRNVTREEEISTMVLAAVLLFAENRSSWHKHMSNLMASQSLKISLGILSLMAAQRSAREKRR